MTLQQFKEQTVEEFDEKFGICTLSLCDEHEKMQCERCKFFSFLLRKIEEAWEMGEEKCNYEPVLYKII